MFHVSRIREHYDYIIYFITAALCLYVQVALQMPDELLKDAAAMVSRLRDESPADVVILADTSYGRYATFTLYVHATCLPVYIDAISKHVNQLSIRGKID